MRIDLHDWHGYLPSVMNIDPASCLFIEHETLWLEVVSNTEIRAWNIENGQCLYAIDWTVHRHETFEPIPIVNASKRGWLLVGSYDGIHIYDLHGGKRLYHLEMPTLTGSKTNARWITHLSIDGHEKVLAAASQNDEVILVDLDSLEWFKTLKTKCCHAQPQLNHVGTLVVARSGHGHLGIWSVADGNCLLEIDEGYLPGHIEAWSISLSDRLLVMLVSSSIHPQLEFFNLQSHTFQSPNLESRFVFTGWRDDQGWIYQEGAEGPWWRLTDPGLELEALEPTYQARLRTLVKEQTEENGSFLQQWHASPTGIVRLAAFLANRDRAQAPLPCVGLAPALGGVFLGCGHVLYRFNLIYPQEPPSRAVFDDQVGEIQIAGDTAVMFVGESLVTLNPSTLQQRRHLPRKVTRGSQLAAKKALMDQAGQRLWYCPDEFQEALACVDPLSGHSLGEFTDMKHHAKDLALAEQGERLYLISGDTRLIGRDLRRQTTLFTQHDRRTRIDAVATNAAGTQLYTSSVQTTSGHALIQYRNGEDGSIQTTWDTGVCGVFHGMALNPTQTMLLAWSENGHLLMLEAPEPRHQITLRAHCGRVRGLWFHGRGFYSTGADDHFLHFWESPFDQPKQSYLFYETGMTVLNSEGVSHYGTPPRPHWDQKAQPAVQPVKRLLLGSVTRARTFENEMVAFEKFVKRYEEFAAGHQKLYYMDHENARLAGYFDHANLDFGLRYDDAFFSKTSVAFDHAFKALVSSVDNAQAANPEAAALFASLPDGLDMLFAMEGLCHESFHLWQTLTLQSCRQMTRSVRRLVACRRKLIKHLLALQGSFAYRPKGSVFDQLLEMDESVFKSFSRLIPRLMDDFDVIDQVRSATNGLSTTDLIEGAAYCAQKTAFHSWDVETLSESKNPMYHRAFNRFKESGGQSHRLFMIWLHVALKHGELVAHHHRERRPSPVDVFLFLLEHFDPAQEEMRLNTIPFNLPKATFDWMRDNPPVRRLCQIAWTAFQRYREAVKEHFELTWDDFQPTGEKLRDLDPRLEAIFQESGRRLPWFMTDEFGLAMVHDPRLIHGMFDTLKDMEDWKIPLEGGGTTTQQADLIVNDFLDSIALLAAGTVLPRCCPDHDPAVNPSLRRGPIFGCTHSDGLNSRAMAWFARPLNNIIR